ncbi:DUF1353 domain-containing protein [Campylobacter volucris]|uniref:DUF1353 domain-containing protein n=2 Tax=Campylobacter volucris TaxID=1031542 RepID=A0A5C7DPX0_9BACT|nr:DUF1353 domain-containing protein [Campylobacter lari]TXE87066.1 DUF1353 domain-containing protein [Campylobacter volucris]
MMKKVILKPFSKDRFILVQDYEFNLKSFKGKIPANFTSNGANIPRIFWSIFPPNSPEYLSAVVVHDYLCEKANTKNDYKLADLALYEAMQELGCSKFKTFVFYHACNGFHMVKCFLKGI